MSIPARRRRARLAPWAVGLVVAGGWWAGRADDGPGGDRLRPLLRGTGPTEAAPHGEGNVYAPEVLVEGGLYRMWYGGQGRDGHDRIHYAESRDGRAWDRKGVALDVGDANHVNDPSVVKVGGVYYLYYTRAMAGVVDEVALATSADGLAWEPRGVVLRPGRDGEWDALLVGRPSVLHEGGTFRMWYDGRKDLPPGAPAANVPKSPTSTRAVGYATSTDGLRWTKHPGNPVFGHDAGGVDVERLGTTLVMARESTAGILAATSDDGITWRDRGLWVPRTGGELDRHGHVTPMILAADRGAVELFLGAARAATWDHNTIAGVPAPPGPLGRPPVD